MGRYYGKPIEWRIINELDIEYLKVMLPKYAAVIIKNDAVELLESIDSAGNAVQKYKDSLLIPLAEAFGAEKCLEMLRTSTGRGRKK